MNEHEFRNIVAAEWHEVPERFRKHVENVALLIEDEPSDAVHKEEGLAPNETLLGLYHGIPATARGSGYGVGATLPDTITLYRIPLLHEARAIQEGGERFSDAVRRAVRETIWHEIGHYFGLDEANIDARERQKTNKYRLKDAIHNKDRGTPDSD